LFDEPLGALDALTRLQLHDELVRIVQFEKSTAVLVTHDGLLRENDRRLHARLRTTSLLETQPSCDDFLETWKPPCV
jgi:ABC-type Fe3+/spermidine/putrescine transport system ATPase subunit